MSRVAWFSSSAGTGSSMRGHKQAIPDNVIRGKLEQKRQAVIKGILRTYGSVDRLDAICLGVRFHVNAETIAQDVQSAREALKREALAEERAAREAEQRRAELMLAREILKRGGV